MDLRQLRYFSQVVESGSFSQAARQLHVAQPALSQHVRTIEDELGVTLLHRGAQGVTPTEAGLRLLHHAKKILAEFAEIPDVVRGDALPRGEVRIGMPGTVSEILATPLIEAAMEKYPDVRIRVVEAMSGYVLDWLRQGNVDLAITYAAPDPRGLRVHHALSEEICLFTSAATQLGSRLDGVTVSFRDIDGLPMVVPGPGNGLRQLIDSSALAAGISIDPTVEIDSYVQIKKLVARGVGFGLLPSMAVGGEAEDGLFRLWRIRSPSVTRKVYLAYSTERPLMRAPTAVGALSWSLLRKLVMQGAWAAELSDEAFPEGLTY